MVVLIFLLCEAFLSGRVVLFGNRKEVEWLLETPPKGHTYEQEVLFLKYDKMATTHLPKHNKQARVYS